MTQSLAIAPPDATEYAPYHARYISLVPGADVVASLESQLESALRLFSGISDVQAEFRYAPDKWSVKEVVGHVSDGERILAYRILRFARNDHTPIEGYDENLYARFAPYPKIRWQDVIDEFIAVRKATLPLLRNLPVEAWSRRGTANQAEVSVRALAYIVAGHALHHRNVLRDKYGVAAG